MASLFEAAGLDAKAPRPLADRLRPTTLEDVLGQDHLIGSDGPLGRMIAAKRLASLVFWGPPGTGKTTIARILASHFDLHFEQITAVFSGVADLRKVFKAARGRRQEGIGTLLFVDEIHRFNRAQQDSFLPYVEDGTVILVGATTENPSFELNAALLSRLQVLVLARLDGAALATLMERAEAAEEKALPIENEARAMLVSQADGDGRYILNAAEMLLAMTLEAPLDVKGLAAVLQRRAPVYDKDRDGHYNLISALHKSLRGSDVDAALYWLARMLVAGEEPMYLIRRLVRFASEDIGMADPQALIQTLAAKDAYHFLGSPEGELAIVQATVYLATAPKSNALYRAEGASRRTAEATGSLMPPMHILNAPTDLMKDLGYGKGYAYDHDAEEGFSGQNYFPDDMARPDAEAGAGLYTPVERGFEREIKKRLDYWAKLRAGRGSGGQGGSEDQSDD
ncbi:MAG: replication-associated recombination protein A [Sphingomonadales bacterium]